VSYLQSGSLDLSLSQEDSHVLADELEAKIRRRFSCGRHRRAGAACQGTGRDRARESYLALQCAVARISAKNSNGCAAIFTRPAIAHKRLSRNTKGQVVLQ
jgi:hypothetical protein